MSRWGSICLIAAGGLAMASFEAHAQNAFVNFETPQVSPLALTPSGQRLLAVNTADARLEVFDCTASPPLWIASIGVGMDPVSVRPRTENEIWVVNHLSDSISIVDLPTGRVVRTIQTGDEPTDVVFAGVPQRAFVTVSQLNQVRVWDPANLAVAPQIVTIQGEDPRALAVSGDGLRVYAAIFESTNPTTIIRQQDVTNPNGPYAGQNPPPNAGTQFDPPLAPALPAPPAVAQIVRRNAAGQWMDDNAHNWSQFVNWNLHDHDVAIIDTTTLGVTYASGMLTTVMGIGVRPDGAVSVVGTEARNEVRFEPHLNGVFLRVEIGTFNPLSPAATQVADLNPHLSYSSATVPQVQRDLSIGDPRAIAWHPTDGRAFVAGMGSNNVAVTDSTGGRLATINVGQGPTGLALKADGTRLYVLNRFEGSISTVDTATNSELSRISFYDPTPIAIRAGRSLLYDTHATSGLGHTACASCHIDGRTDFLAWDLGNPAGAMKAFNQDCRQPTCPPWHPMKGPMVTQTLQGIVGTEPFHWRGDRENVAAFAPAYTDLQGDDTAPAAGPMQSLTDFIATIRFPPNPNRNLDNTLPAVIAGSNGNGNPNNGLNIYNTLPTVGGSPCISCHGPIPGSGTNGTIDFPGLPLAPQNLKMAQLRNLHEKTGFNKASQQSNRGFGYNHHSEFDTVFNLLFAGFAFAPGPPGLQQRRDVEALMLCFSTDTHAAVGQQVTFDGTNNNDPTSVSRLNLFTTLADSAVVSMVARARVGGLNRGYAYLAGGALQSDRQSESTTTAALRSSAAPGSEVTFTVVVSGSQSRIGIDRDADGSFDRDELEACGDPVNAAIRAVLRGDSNDDGFVNLADVNSFVALLLNPAAGTDRQRCGADVNRDTLVDGRDVSPFTVCALVQGCP